MAELTHGLVDASLLEKIHNLFALNIGADIDLPQIVVVGHQSSGKSSVLTALADLPFPRDSDLCTRFATQIIFRRSSDRKITASIIPAKESSGEHHEKMKAWNRDLTALDASGFAEIMAEATAIMGVKTKSDGAPSSAFTNDVLVIEIAGPTQEHFSIIDIPGIFRRTTQGLTTKEDIVLVDNMVKGYMANSRSVMLVVVPCNVDIATQEIIEKAEDLDPHGDRTLGVLTKPDLVDLGAEMAIVDLIEGKRHRLKLGWHLLRNPGQAELLNSSKTHSSIEDAFFTSAGPWNRLEKDKVGIKSLKYRLQDILATHIRREFPKVKAEIVHKSRINSGHLKRLGPKRQTQSEQAQYIMDIVLRFQELATAAVSADYRQADFFSDELRLATIAVNRGKIFNDSMATSGHEYSFKDSDEPGEETWDSYVAGVSLNEREPVQVRVLEDHIDLQDILQPDSQIDFPRNGDILEWLASVHQHSRGFEIGTFASSILAVTMQKQASKWRALALGYISDIITAVHTFLLELLEFIVPSEHVREGLLSLISDQLMEKYQAALQQTEFLLQVELNGTPATYNHYFNETLEKYRNERLTRQLAGKAIKDCKHGTVVRLDDITGNDQLSTDEHTVREIHDILKSYYKLARKRFVDCVRMQAADFHLVLGSDTPLKLLSARFVTGLTAAQLEAVAGEEPGVKRERAQLEKRVELLEKGLKILR